MKRRGVPNEQETATAHARCIAGQVPMSVGFGQPPHVISIEEVVPLGTGEEEQHPQVAERTVSLSRLRHHADKGVQGD